MGPRRAQRASDDDGSPSAQAAKKRQPDRFNVWLPVETKQRINAVKTQIKRRIGFVPDYTQLVQYLVDDALKRLERELEEAGPPEAPKLL